MGVSGDPHDSSGSCAGKCVGGHYLEPSGIDYIHLHVCFHGS